MKNMELRSIHSYFNEIDKTRLRNKFVVNKALKVLVCYCKASCNFLPSSMLIYDGTAILKVIS